ncbi:MAG: hypothetical protein KAX80_13210, partial [Planctomycetes bacterium]|nr:hypothetical protein [Planctomycetota bacterium]
VEGEAYEATGLYWIDLETADPDYYRADGWLHDVYEAWEYDARLSEWGWWRTYPELKDISSGGGGEVMPVGRAGVGGPPGTIGDGWHGHTSLLARVLRADDGWPGLHSHLGGVGARG